MKSFLLLFLFSCIFSIGKAQHFTISGHVKEKSSGETLVGASVFVKETSKGVVTNSYGFYSLTLPGGKYTLIVSSMGLNDETLDITLSGDIVLDVELPEASESLQEVVLESKKIQSELNVKSSQMGVTRITSSNLKEIPLLFGEADVLKVLQLTPGVSSTGEGNSGFTVRGGTPDQNLVILDEAPVYNASHLIGFLSVFNSDAIKNTELYKGSAPAKYGGRASSVVDITMKDGNRKEYKYTGSIGLLSSKLTLEGPIIEDKASFIISARRTFLDFFTSLDSKRGPFMGDTSLYFYDINAKLSFELGKKDKLYISGYKGRDVFFIRDAFNIDWGNLTSTIRWNHLYSDQLFSNTTFVFSRYDYKTDITYKTSNYNIAISSYLQDFNLKQDYTYYTEKFGKIYFGIGSIYHDFSPGADVSISGNLSQNIKIYRRYAFESSAYVSNELNLNDNLNVHYGLRLNLFNLVGPGTYYEFDENGNVINTDTFGTLEGVKSYFGLEPRISSSYAFDDSHSIKSSYTRNYQYMHLLSTGGTGIPIDAWIPSSNIIKPQIVDQVSAGYFFNFLEQDFETSVEIFYKWLQNQIDYKIGADVIGGGNEIESELVFGKGKSYGLEFFLRKNSGKLTGWIGYTLSRSFRQFDDLNQGNTFPYRFDKIHDLSVVLTYNFSEKLTFSTNWVFSTGNAVTYPVGKYNIGENFIPYYEGKNEQRMPNYHRLDLGINFYTLKTKEKEACWSLSIYNTYARKNAWAIDFVEETDNNGVKTGKMVAMKTYLFTILPSISFSFKF